MKINVKVATAMALLCGATPGCVAGAAGDRDAVFVFQHRAAPGIAGQFSARTSDVKVITQARQELAKPETERTLHVNGQLAAGADGNAPWNWHFVDNGWKLAEISMGGCDGTPGLVEQNLEFWLTTVTRFCPWQAYVLGERKE